MLASFSPVAWKLKKIDFCRKIFVILIPLVGDAYICFKDRTFAKEYCLHKIKLVLLFTIVLE